ncbi:hypothetical protein KUTeg_014251 [Tegillarca granosa]|uniref:EF-hand domain-containing protein n=1 Tax=Tegillarca granosa TaxID=220873 RepID=A0ABQ9EZJ6_TEGGR|nr:hypothetical protein KUTeg_014251 [Tegillarca granosa]
MVYANTRNRDQKDYKEEIIKAFHMYDRDLNNELDLHELRRVLMSLDGLEKISLLEVKEIMNDFDFNGDGVISVSDYSRKG